MRFGLIGVTEAQISIIFMLLIASFFGPEVFQTIIFGYELRHILFWISLTGICYGVLESIVTTFKYCWAELSFPHHSVTKLGHFAFFIILSYLWIHAQT